MKIYIIRHGETDANRKGVLQGSSDWPLNDSGFLLAKLTGEALSDVRFDAVFSSPLLRARQTAETILAENEHPVDIIYDDRLREICMGDWEGRVLKEIDDSEAGLKPGELAKLFVTNPTDLGRFPGGEGIADVEARTQEFLKELAEKDYGTVLISTHGCALRCMLNFIYPDGDKDFWHVHVPYNCAVNILKVENGCFRLVGDDVTYYSDSYIVDRYKGGVKNGRGKAQRDKNRRAAGI